jgi:PAS domain S-box-containing protein
MRDKVEPGLEDLKAELAESRRQLAEAQELIRAIQSGDVDAVVIDGPGGSQVYTLRNADTSYRFLVEAMNEGAANLGADGSILYCNQKLSGLTGMPLERVIGQSVKRLFAKKFQPVLDGLIERTLRGEPATAETNLIGRNGRRRIPVHLSLRRILSDESGGICMVVTDLTEQNERERRVAIERKRLFEILEALPAMICLLTMDHKVVFANRMFRDKFGEANGRPCYEFRFGQSSPCAFCESFKPLKTGRQHRWQMQGPDGSIIEAYDLPLIDADGSKLILEMDIDITAQKRSEAELQEHRAQLRLLAARLEDAREDERTRVARDLHDDIGQILTAIKMDLASVRKRLSSPSNEVRERLNRMMGLMDEGVKSVRRVCSDLRPGVLDDLGLAAAIEWQAKEFSSRTGIRCEVSISPGSLRLKPTRATVVFRIFQECLTNVMRHAQANSVRVSLDERDGDIYLCVADDGKGFSETAVSGSLGLLGMKERARGGGGELQIVSAPGKGTAVTLRVPE